MKCVLIKTTVYRPNSERPIALFISSSNFGLASHLAWNESGELLVGGLRIAPPVEVKVEVFDPTVGEVDASEAIRADEANILIIEGKQPPGCA